jgi:pilus assembly protein CpaB
MLLLAVVLAGGAALIANKWLEGQLTTSSELQAGMASVVAASVDIPYGQQVELANVKLISLPKDSMPVGTYSDPTEVEGMIAGQNILKGEVLLKGRVVEHLGGSTLSAVIEPGMRAVAVAVNEIIGVAGFLLPGNKVDVLSSQGRGGSMSVSTILQDIKVLAVDQTVSPDKSEPVVVKAVTLEVTPAQAEVLVKATSQGKVQLSLRNPRDDQLIVAEQVLEEAPAQVKDKVVKKPYYAPKVTMIRGTSVSSDKVSK